MTNLQNLKAVFTFIVAGTVLAMAAAFMPASAHAASYAYVDANGEVRSVTADTWQLAIATAPNIHIHSGVLLLRTAADQQIIGDDVAMVK